MLLWYIPKTELILPKKTREQWQTDTDFIAGYLLGSSMPE